MLFEKSGGVYSYHMGRGNSYRELKDWAKAAADYSEAARLAPQEGGPLFQLGWACIHGGNSPGAIDAFRRLAKLTPDDPYAHGNLGIALFNARDYAAAADSYRQVVKLDPKSAKFRIEQGMILLAKGDVDEAILAYRIALQLEPESKAAKDGLDRALRAKK